MKISALILGGVLVAASPLAITATYAASVAKPKTASASVSDMASQLVTTANTAEADAIAAKKSPDEVSAAIQAAITAQVQAFVAAGASPADITAAVQLAASGAATCVPDPKNVAICKASPGALAALNAASRNLAALFGGTGPGAINNNNNNPDGSVPQAQVTVVPGTNYRGN